MLITLNYKLFSSTFVTHTGIRIWFLKQPVLPLQSQLNHQQNIKKGFLSNRFLPRVFPFNLQHHQSAFRHENNTTWPLSEKKIWHEIVLHNSSFVRITSNRGSFVWSLAVVPDEDVPQKMNRLVPKTRFPATFEPNKRLNMQNVLLFILFLSVVDAFIQPGYCLYGLMSA